MKLHDLYFEDFTPGLKVVSPGLTMTESEIIDMALRFDPQPFHIDVEAAKKTHFGGLIASGFHTMAVSWRLLYQTGVLLSANLGGPGVDELRWHKPVRPGDVLRVHCRIEEVRRSISDPSRGAARVRITTLDQNGVAVQSMLANLLAFGRP